MLCCAAPRRRLAALSLGHVVPPALPPCESLRFRLARHRLALLAVRALRAGPLALPSTTGGSQAGSSNRSVGLETRRVLSRVRYAGRRRRPRRPAATGISGPRTARSA